MADEKTSRWINLMMSFEVLSGNYATRAFLQKQYFPNVRTYGEELPPLFSSESFSVEAARELSTLSQPTAAPWVEVRTRRFDGLVRRLGIPHPVPYVKLVLLVHERWDDLLPLLDNEVSQIKPEWYSDGRIIQMDYASGVSIHGHLTQLSQGRQYRVQADVSSCYPSVYSHALDWALRGKHAAKQWSALPKSKQPPKWEAELDKLARNCVNRETKGLLIGPAISNVLAELILQRVDESLAEYHYVRFIDDYSGYFVTREEAEEFLLNLQRTLAVYRLDINTRKTRIVSLREVQNDPWMADVLSQLPTGPDPLRAARYLQYAEIVAHRNPADSVLKFAAKTLFGQEWASDSSSMLVVDELVRLTQFHPHILAILSAEVKKLGKAPASDTERLASQLRAQLVQAAHRAETDSVLWLIYMIEHQLGCRLEVNHDTLSELLDLNDDLVWIALACLGGEYLENVTICVRDMTYDEESDRQEHWLARYELWHAGALKDSDLSAEELSWMEILRKHSVSFSSCSAPSDS